LSLKIDFPASDFTKFGTLNTLFASFDLLLNLGDLVAVI